MTNEMTTLVEMINHIKNKLSDAEDSVSRYKKDLKVFESLVHDFGKDYTADEWQEVTESLKNHGVIA